MRADAGATWEQARAAWPTPSTDEVREWALRYTGLGWVVWACRGPLPGGRCTCGKPTCQAAGKHGRPGWSGDPSKMIVPTMDQQREQASAYWSDENSRFHWKVGKDGREKPGEPVDNLAVLPHLSNLLVLDIDSRKAWDALHSHYGRLPETLIEVSGRGDGWHLFFHAGVDYQVQSSVWTPAGGVEVKHRSLVLATPSLHKRGGRYAWHNWGTPVAEAPEWLTRPAPERRVTVSDPETGLPRELSEGEIASLKVHYAGDGTLNDWQASALQADLVGVERLRRLPKGDAGRPRVMFARGGVAGRVDRGWRADRASGQATCSWMPCARTARCPTTAKKTWTRQIDNGLRVGRSTALTAALAAKEPEDDSDR